MKKEVIFAILIGFGIGLVITFSIYLAQKQISNEITTEINDISNQPLEETQSIEQDKHSLEVVTPVNYALLESTEVTVTGFTSPSSYLTVVSQTEEVVVRANTSGSFAFDFKLSSGVNIITITAFDESGNSVSEDITLTLVEPKLDLTNDQESDSEQTDE